MALILPNLLFLFSGIVLLCVGLWLHCDRESSLGFAVLRRLPASPLTAAAGPSDDDAQHAHAVFPLCLVVLGAVIAVLSLLGCSGPCFDSSCLLTSYVALLVLVLLSQITLAILIVATRQRILTELDGTLRRQVQLVYNGSSTAHRQIVPRDAPPTYDSQLTAAWDRMHVELSCCGSSEPRDFYLSSWFNATNADDDDGDQRASASFQPTKYVPVSCCVLAQQNTPDRQTADDSAGGDYSYNGDAYQRLSSSDTLAAEECQNAAKQLFDASYVDENKATTENPAGSSNNSQYGLHTQGCRHAILQRIHGNGDTVITVFSVITLLQVVDMVLACILIRWLRTKCDDCESIKLDYYYY